MEISVELFEMTITISARRTQQVSYSFDNSCEIFSQKSISSFRKVRKSAKQKCLILSFSCQTQMRIEFRFSRSTNIDFLSREYSNQRLIELNSNIQKFVRKERGKPAWSCFGRKGHMIQLSSNWLGKRTDNIIAGLRPTPFLLFLLFCLFAASLDLEFSLTAQIFLLIHLMCLVSQHYNSWVGDVVFCMCQVLYTNFFSKGALFFPS